MTETSKDKRSPEARRKRVNKLKKMILTTIVLLILIPLLGCSVMGIYIYHLRKELRNTTQQYEWMEKLFLDEKDKTERLNALLDMKPENKDSLEENPQEEIPAVNETDMDMESPEMDDRLRKVYLTFDDGPSEETDRILDILDEYQVKATFFVTGKPDDKYGDVYRRIVADGHTLGMHSFSHNYSRIYASEEAFREDVEQLRDYLYQETGVESFFYRFPGGSSNTVSRTSIQQLITYLNKQNIVYFDWNVSAGDATSEYVSSERITSRVISQVGEYKEAVVLMHDSSDKKSTVEALPMIIEGIQEMENTVILPISDATIPVQHISVMEE
ncbi:MAG: polysaccharide deacetylase family protein [Lachnospiraceae bacterium]